MSDTKHFETSHVAHNKWSKYILIVLAALVLILSIWCICVMIGSFGTVKNITVQGEAPYSDERIIAVSDIEQGIKIKHIDSRDVENAILDFLPCIADVSVKKKASGEVIISVTPEKIGYVANISGDRYVMSDELRILCLYGDVEFDKEPLNVALPYVKRAIVGEKIEFYDNSDFIGDFFEMLESSHLIDSVTFADFSDKYNLNVLYEDKYTICFGDLENINLKLQKVYVIMEDVARDGKGKAIIDVSDVSHPTVKLLS